jgi:NADH-quinone oxidoreductase subunit I
VPTRLLVRAARELCDSGHWCEFVCPPQATRFSPGRIAEDSVVALVDQAPKELEIDMLRWIYCGLCQEVCPEEAIFLQTTYSVTGTTRAEFVNNKQKLYEMGGTIPDQHFKWEKKRKAAEHGNAH